MYNETVAYRNRRMILDNAIKEFLAERKVGWIKKKSSPTMTSEDLSFVEQEAENIFKLDNWLPDAAKRAGQLSLVSHPSKFSHPGSKTTPIIAECQRSEDGFLRTGNAFAQLDVDASSRFIFLWPMTIICCLY